MQQPNSGPTKLCAHVLSWRASCLICSRAQRVSCPTCWVDERFHTVNWETWNLINEYHDSALTSNVTYKFCFLRVLFYCSMCHVKRMLNLVKRMLTSWKINYVSVSTHWVLFCLFSKKFMSERVYVNPL